MPVSPLEYEDKALLTDLVEGLTEEMSVGWFLLKGDHLPRRGLIACSRGVRYVPVVSEIGNRTFLVLNREPDKAEARICRLIHPLLSHPAFEVEVSLAQLVRLVGHDETAIRLMALGQARNWWTVEVAGLPQEFDTHKNAKLVELALFRIKEKADELLVVAPTEKVS